MIGYLNGTVLSAGQNSLILKVGGVGYKVEVLTDSIMEGQDIELFIHTHVREQELTLYGFIVKSDLELFEMLINVSGVGPKSAQTILNEAGSGNIINAVRSANPSLIKVKGIGQRTAEKIIIELKGKLDRFQASQSDTSEIQIIEKEIYLDVIEALSSLGYRKSEIDNALNNISVDEPDAESLIKQVLQFLKS